MRSSLVLIVVICGIIVGSELCWRGCNESKKKHLWPFGLIVQITFAGYCSLALLMVILFRVRQEGGNAWQIGGNSCRIVCENAWNMVLTWGAAEWWQVGIWLLALTYGLISILHNSKDEIMAIGCKETQFVEVSETALKVRDALTFAMILLCGLLVPRANPATANSLRRAAPRVFRVVSASLLAIFSAWCFLFWSEEAQHVLETKMVGCSHGGKKAPWEAYLQVLFPMLTEMLVFAAEEMYLWLWEAAELSTNSRQ
eukprot:g82329.t1